MAGIGMMEVLILVGLVFVMFVALGVYLTILLMRRGRSDPRP